MNPGFRSVAASVGSAAVLSLGTPGLAAQTRPIRFMTLDPGHFHAALVHKEMYPRVSPDIDIYAPLGFDLIEHLGRLSAFNNRTDRPTGWRVEVHTGPDYLERMLRERPGTVVVLAGRSSRKIDYVERSIAAGMHLLVDKPWIIRSADLPRLEEVLELAEARGLVAYDIMTERFEVTNALQRELVNDHAIFGRPLRGTPEEPAVHIRSVHYIVKTVAGAPLRRPVWWFDPEELGEALSDVGTHLVDLSMWTLFPEQPLDHRRDVTLVSARRWPTAVSREHFRRLTGEADFPASLSSLVRGDSLACACNTQVVYTLRGVHVRLDALWETEAEHGDTHHAVYRGERARVEVRQGAEEGWTPQVYVVPATAAAKEAVRTAVTRRVDALQQRWPGLAVEDRGESLLVTVPQEHRLGHERHFAEVASRFLELVEDPASVPAWEKANMVTKYHITTSGTEMSHAGP